MLKRSLMQIFAKMIRPPPPIPCMTLAAINILIFTLTAAKSDPTKNTRLAANRAGLRPKMSHSFPHTGVAAEDARRKLEPIHV